MSDAWRSRSCSHPMTNMIPAIIEPDGDAHAIKAPSLIDAHMKDDSPASVMAVSFYATMLVFSC